MFLVQTIPEVLVVAHGFDREGMGWGLRQCSLELRRLWSKILVELHETQVQGCCIAPSGVSRLLQSSADFRKGSMSLSIMDRRVSASWRISAMLDVDSHLRDRTTWVSSWPAGLC
mmetsp:Transcript_19174/g.53832  ORF Transcript_19174/g.53832 Transcript_19174/m.53832 type:complete len:115 (+) Transcript_19174:254-598(+)